jgi:dienelactone hydrolase
MSRRPLSICGVVLALVAGAGLPAAWSSSGSFDAPCPLYGDQRICSALVPSFDGATLDVDVTQPMQGTGASHPLMVMLHGLGGDKHDWESVNDVADGADRWHWNSQWFARHGYYVLTYTARGFTDDGPSGSQPNTPSYSSVSAPNGTVHLKSREFEIRDTQWLAAVAAASFSDLDPNRVAVTGGSYGGGESWLLAAQPTWTFPHSVNPSLPVLQLQVAVPKYPWTDLGYSLAPDGHGGGPSGTDLYSSSLGRASSDTGNGFPVGVPKYSYLNALYALANTKGVLEEGTTVTPNSEGPVNFALWFDRAVTVGDPYDIAGAEDPLVAQIRRGLTEFRSSYYQDEGWEAQVGEREVAVFSIEGWTDDLFTAVESFRQFKYLKGLDPMWPVSLAVADVGHSRAQNRPDTWHRLNVRAWQFLQSQIGGSHRLLTTVYSEPTICAETGQQNLTAAQELTAMAPEGLSRGSLVVAFQSGGTTTNDSGVGDPNGPATDPIAAEILGQDTCRTSPGPAAGGYTAESAPLPDSRLYVGLGYAEVPYQMDGGDTATVAVRIWDEVPDGQTVLVTRGVYRIDAPAYDTAAGTIRIPLFGNEWQLQPGHRIRLDVTQADFPTFKPSNVATSLTFHGPTLVLPTREAGTQVLQGA